MRVRQFELRIIGIALTVAWAVAALLVLFAYRPGGPLDVLVGVTFLMPVVIAVGGVAWPPVARGSGAFPVMVSLGVGALLLLLPSIGGIVNQLLALGSQTLLPSLEAAYPWLLALVLTSLFTGFGLARQTLGGTAMRPRRLRRGAAVATLMTTLVAVTFAGVAVANELALRELAVAPGASRFGPTDIAEDPPRCDGDVDAGPAARVDGHFAATLDLRPIGSVELNGLRAGDDFRWLAYAATAQELGQYGAARNGERAWSRSPDRGWAATSVEAVADGTLDRLAVEVALAPGNRAASEDRGIEVIEGAPARRCRIAIDGETFRAAFPQVRWLIGGADLGHWRGQLDYWVFLDGQVGQIAGSLNGEGSVVEDERLLGTIDVLLTATERERDFVIYPPAR